MGGQRIFDAPVIAGDGDEFHGLFEAGEVIGEGFVGGFDRIVLFAGEKGGGAGNGAPVIENFRNMADFRKIGDQADDAESEVPVLRALVAKAKAAGLAHQRSAVDGEVRRVVLREKEVGQEVGFEVGLVAVAFLVDFVFVGVEEIGGGIGVVRHRDLVERVRRELVVVIEQGDEVAGGEGKGGVGSGGDVAVFFAEADFDAGIGGRVVLKQRADVGRG